MTGVRPVRAAVVGAGLMGRWHADAIARVGGRVAYVVDEDLRRAEALAFACTSGTNAVCQLTDVPAGSVEVAHVCTPLETHARLTREALEAGLHVLCEKPLAENGRVTAELLAIARAHARLLCPTHQFLFQRGMQRGFRAVADIGPMLHVDGVACSAGAVGRFANDPDGLIGEILPHPLAILARLFPGELASADWHVHHPFRGEFRASAQIGGASVALLVSARGRPTVNALRLIGEAGTIEVDMFHGFALLEGAAVSRVHKAARPFTRSSQMLVAAGVNLAQRALRGEVAYPGLRALVQRFYAAMRGEGPAPIPASEILEVACARDALIARHAP